MKIAVIGSKGIPAGQGGIEQYCRQLYKNKATYIPTAPAEYIDFGLKQERYILFLGRLVDLKRNKAPIIGIVINNAGRQKQKLLEDFDFNEIGHKSSLLIGSTQTDNSHGDAEEISQP